MTAGQSWKMLPTWTNLVAVDSKHVLELEVSLPTWRRHYPEIFERPTLLLYHREVSAAKVSWAIDEFSRVGSGGRGGVECRAIAVEPQNGWTHRELMLTALVMAPLYVATPHFLKIDTDAIAVERVHKWACDCWFSGGPAYVASPWGYTKPAGFLQRLDEWSDRQPDLFGLPKPSRKYGQRGADGVASHRRCISWLYFGDTQWHRSLAERLAAGSEGDGRLPVPSQDTITSYMATLLGARVAYRKMQHWGWRHVSGGPDGLRRAIAERGGVLHATEDF